MWISQGTWLNQLQSNKLHYTKNPETNVTLGIRVDVYTRSLTILDLSVDRINRLKLISDLSDQGLSTREISSLLNLTGYPSQTGVLFTPKLVWMTLKKWRNRKLRESDTYSIIHPPKFYLRTIQGLKKWKRS